MKPARHGHVAATRATTPAHGTVDDGLPPDTAIALRKETRTAIVVWGLLIVLALTTVASAYIPMGAWNAAVNFLIAAVKAGLVGACYMRLRGGSPVLRLVCGTAITVGALLFVLGGVDYTTRQPSSTPPPGPDAIWPDRGRPAPATALPLEPDARLLSK
jgi:caa(3)-type oxidase subunit IV